MVSTSVCVAGDRTGLGCLGPLARVVWADPSRARDALWNLLRVFTVRSRALCWWSPNAAGLFGDPHWHWAHLNHGEAAFSLICVPLVKFSVLQPSRVRSKDRGLHSTEGAARSALTAAATGSSLGIVPSFPSPPLRVPRGTRSLFAEKTPRFKTSQKLHPWMERVSLPLCSSPRVHVRKSPSALEGQGETAHLLGWQT